ncbi:DNA gyrase subunit A [Chitinophaga costaii]|uniref:DNA gyrase subunit A n=1 Tax=Chitinophaga costaii TaxID=1335309 RepID=A0A1C4FDQ1_9BACT|nr:DNA gyrase subunit A [Chitinophaga costaii]PUZ20646.1 DNA gyrase subunit A [Chitinophaga costaii]SCC54147.1 DNA gyrase subunit A [Chitinophaga costaii]
MIENQDNLENPENQDGGDDSRIVRINIEEQMKTAYIDYSMSVIVGRALPDVRDGLKPVHRRVLFGMKELGNGSNKPYKKSARIVGEVMGKYHPHGDASIYDTIVRLAQHWSMRYPMVDGQGNFGSVDGDMPAAMRYTEIRLQKIAEALLEDLDKDTVDFTLNFDDTLEEPTVLPTRIPNLLVNGAAGIAVGMATNIMPHNLSEVVDACVAVIDNRDLSIDDIIKHVKAPDFPTGGVIYGYEGVKQGFETGRGRVVVRGRINVETSKAGRERLVIYELPYQINKAVLHQKIAQLVNDKIIEGISDVRDESDRDGMRLVIDLKREAIANVVINQLFKYSELQTSYGINNVALVKGRPRILNIKELLTEFIDFRHEVVVRRTNFELREAEKRAHILAGYLIALDHLDEVISLIRNSRSPDEAKEGLITNFQLSEIQAKAILELRLQRLTGMERDKIREEYESIMKLIAHLKDILSNESLRFQIIKEELEDVKKRFGDERKTEIQYLASEMRIEDIIAEEDVVITISHLGYIKRTSAYDFRQQKRGGRGAIGGKTRDEDYIEHLFVASTHHTMLFFTEKGRCFWLKVYEIPEGEKQGKGRAIQNLINLPPEDKIRAIIDIKDLSDSEFINNHYILLCTQRGIIKKTLLEEFSRPRQNGVNAITINDGDRLLDVKLTDGSSEVMMALRSGRAIRFPEDAVRDTGRGAIGVRGIEVDNEHDEVVGMICAKKDDDAHTVLVVSERGFGKRTGIEEYRVTNRGGKGVKTINITEKTGRLIAIMNVTEKDDLMITCKSGITIRMAVRDVREAGRATQGVRLIRLDDNDSIAAIARLDEQEEQVDLVEEGMVQEAVIIDPETLSADDLAGETPADEEGEAEKDEPTTE